MSKFEIYQIFYDEKSKAMLDNGFIPLNNTENARPDWGEFWVIRNFLNNFDLDEKKWYGFFSPKFQQKSGLSSTQVQDFITSSDPEIDVITFSPFWEQISFFSNVFEQGEYWHPGLTAVSQEFFSQAGENYDIRKILMHSKNSVYCNYFLAKPNFWRYWLKIGDFLFNYAEESTHPLYKHLCSKTFHNNHTGYDFKIFIQERLASFLLCTKDWKISNYPIFQTKNNSTDLSIFKEELIACDALKICYLHSRDPAYLNEYLRIKQEISRRLNIHIQ